MASEPKDEVVKTEIISTVDKMGVSMRPNKLRKIICKKVDGTNWTQYQRVLESILESKILKTKAVDGEMMILPSLANCQNQTKKLEDKDSSDVKKKTEVIEVPLAIIRHLLKKGHKKKITSNKIPSQKCILARRAW